MFSGTYKRTLRTFQKIREKWGTVDKTEFDAELQQKLDMGKRTGVIMSEVVERMKPVVQPDPSLRQNKDFNPAAMNNLERLGQAMKDAGGRLGPPHDLSRTLQIIGCTLRENGLAEREFITASQKDVIKKLKMSLRTDDERMKEARDRLEKRRLDLDVAKNSVHRNKKGLDDPELELARALFDVELEAVQNLLNSYSEIPEVYKKCLNEFLKCQRDFVLRMVTNIDEYLERLAE